MNDVPTSSSVMAVQTISSTKMAVALIFLGAAIVAAAASFSLSSCASDPVPDILLSTEQIPGLAFGDAQKKNDVASYTSAEYDPRSVSYFYVQPAQGGTATISIQYLVYDNVALAQQVANRVLSSYSNRSSTSDISYTFEDQTNKYFGESVAGCLSYITEREPLGVDCLIQKDTVIVKFTQSDLVESSLLPNILLEQIAKNLEQYTAQCSLVPTVKAAVDFSLQELLVKKDNPLVIVETPPTVSLPTATVPDEVGTMTVGIIFEGNATDDLSTFQVTAQLQNDITKQLLRPFATFKSIPTTKHEVTWNGNANVITFQDLSFGDSSKYFLTMTLDLNSVFAQDPDMKRMVLSVELDGNRQYSETDESNNARRLIIKRPDDSLPIIRSAEFFIPQDTLTVGVAEEYCVVVKGKYSDDPDTLVDIQHRGDTPNPPYNLPDVNFAFEPIGNADVRPLTCEAGEGFGIVAPNEVGEHMLMLHVVVNGAQVETPVDRLKLIVVEPKVVDEKDDSNTFIDVCSTLEGIQLDTDGCPAEKQTTDTASTTDKVVTGGSIGGGSAGGSSSGGGSSGGGGGGGFVAPSAPTIEMPTVAAGTSGSLAVVQINQGVKSTANSTVTLNMPTTSADQMAISNTANFEGVSWEPYKKTKSWNLTSGLGNKTVYIKFRNSKNGGVTKVYTASIEVVKKVSEPKTNVTAPKPSVQCSLIPGKPYKLPNQSTIYYITSQCTKRPFKSSEVFFTYFGSWSEVQTVSTLPQNDTIQFMPWGPKYNPKSGALIKVPEDSKVYLLINGKKYWITSEPVFLGLGYQWNWVEDADVNLLNAFQTVGELSGPNVHQDGTVMKYGNSTKVYVLEGGKKRWIVNEAAFNKLGYRWDRIVTIPASEVYPDGADLK